MEDEELAQLKTVYDELWSDARTMIKDMKRSINLYPFFGFLSLVLSTIMTGSAISNWNIILLGDASSLNYLYAIAATLGVVVYVAFGILSLYWYNKLRKRYSRLILLEKSLED